MGMLLFLLFVIFQGLGALFSINVCWLEFHLVLIFVIAIINIVNALKVTFLDIFEIFLSSILV